MQEENIEIPEPVQEAETRYDSQQPVAEQVTSKSPFFTFNFNTVLGLILLVGLVVLYILYFTGRDKHVASVPLTLQKTSGKQLSVVFVNIDSINTHYEYVKLLRKDLEGTGKRLQTEVLAEQAALEKEANEFQQKMSVNAIPEDKAKAIYEQLMQKQQALMQKKDHYTQQIAEQEMNMNMRLVDSVTTFLKRFNRQYHFDYIMGYKAGGEILVSNDTLDITSSVLEELNKEYQQRKK
ncbi:MAG: OmpH family outer membrane protein [Bacteroidales bacterium]